MFCQISIEKHVTCFETFRACLRCLCCALSLVQQQLTLCSYKKGSSVIMFKASDHATSHVLGGRFLFLKI